MSSSLISSLKIIYLIIHFHFYFIIFKVFFKEDLGTGKLQLAKARNHPKFLVHYKVNCISYHACGRLHYCAVKITVL